MFEGDSMIIARSPLRITFGGGGSDILSFSNQYGGFCISAAINKYVYVVVNRLFKEEIVLKYSEIEKVNTVDEVKHSTIKEALKLLKLKLQHFPIFLLLVPGLVEVDRLPSHYYEHCILIEILP